MASPNTHLDALQLAHDVRDRMVNFFADDHYVRDAKLSKMCRDFWSGSQENGGLVGDLWVEGGFPGRSVAGLARIPRGSKPLRPGSDAST